MRFDKHIKLITLSTESDGLGGRTEVENIIMETMCNFEELSLETTIKIYGEAITQNVKAIILGDIKEKIDKIEFNNTKYKVISQRKIKNKTSFFLEVDND